MEHIIAQKFVPHKFIILHNISISAFNDWKKKLGEFHEFWNRCLGLLLNKY